MTQIVLALIALALSGVLGALALLHILWGIGFWWPIRDEDRLVAAVIGLRGATRMPGPIPCSLVAVGFLAALIWLWLPPGTLRQAGLALAATAFGIRGFVPWRPGWRMMTAREPFATLDRRAYGPLALVLAAGFAAHFIAGLP